MRAIFQRKGQKRTESVKKGQERPKYLKVWAKMFKI